MKAERGKYVKAFDTDAEKYGGAGSMHTRVFEAKRRRKNDVNCYMKFRLPRLSCVYIVKKEKKPSEWEELASRLNICKDEG